MNTETPEEILIKKLEDADDLERADKMEERDQQMCESGEELDILVDLNTLITEYENFYPTKYLKGLPERILENMQIYVSKKKTEKRIQKAERELGVIKNRTREAVIKYLRDNFTLDEIADLGW